MAREVQRFRFAGAFLAAGFDFFAGALFFFEKAFTPEVVATFFAAVFVRSMVLLPPFATTLPAGVLAALLAPLDIAFLIFPVLPGTIEPSTPPTTAPMGPATIPPTTAPAAAPAALSLETETVMSEELRPGCFEFFGFGMFTTC